MNDAVCVSGVESGKHLNDNLENLVETEFISFDEFPNRLTFDVFSRDVMNTGTFSDFVDGQNVGMLQGRCGPGFGLKSAKALFIGNEVRRKNLQRHRAIKPAILSEVNLTHAAAPEQFDDLVGTNLAGNSIVIICGDKHLRILFEGGLLH